MSSTNVAAPQRHWISATTIGDLVDRAAAETDGLAVGFPDERATYPELAARSDEVARALAGHGIGPGDKVGLLMPNCLDFVVVLIAVAKLGAVAVPVNGRFKAHELGFVIEHADVRLLVTAGSDAGTDYPALIGEVFPGLATGDPQGHDLPEAPLLRHVVDLGGKRAGFLTREAFLARAADVPIDRLRLLQERVRIRDVGLLMYTSGTTGRPKGCLLTHESLVRHGANVACTRFFLTAEDRFWDPLPLFHIGGIVPMLGCFSVRCAYFHAGHFDPEVALRTLEEERCTVAYPSFETIWLAVLNLPRFPEADLSALRLVQNIAIPERLAQMQERLPHAPQVCSFGATECASNLAISLPDDPLDVRIDTLGKVVPGMEARIVDPETGKDRLPNEVGELLIRGYARFEGYYKEPELTAASIDADGWFHSADLASIDADGNLVYEGRLKDMLKVGGENVSALEVEGYLATHPAVGIVQVVAAPDARYVEVPAAFVMLRDGQTATEQEMIDFCVGQIASYKVPRYVRFVTEWPMSGTKIQKFALRERIAAELNHAGITEAPRVNGRSAGSTPGA